MHPTPAQAGDGAIAVITVHGVGDQVPGATAHEVVGLLQKANSAKSGPVYGPFTTATIDLAVTPRGHPGDPAADPADLEFTRKALDEVVIDEHLARYATVVCSGECRMPDGGTRRVDVFEFYWADLSRLGEGMVRILGSLYQLLFHLASIGLKTVSLAGKPADTGRAMRSLCGAHVAAEALIGAVVPILNLYMLCAIVPVLIVAIPGDYRGPLVGLLAGTATGTAAFLGLRAGCRSPHGSGMRPLLSVAVFVAVSLAASRIFDGHYTLAIWGIASLAALGLAGYLTHLLHVRREPASAARSAAWWTAILSTALWVGVLVARWPKGGFGADGSVVTLSMSLAEGFLLALQFLWAVLLVVIGWLCASGYIAGRGMERHAPLRRAIWTGKMGVFIPSCLFLTLTLVVWAALLGAFDWVERIRGTEYQPWLYACVSGPDRSPEALAWVERLYCKTKFDDAATSASAVASRLLEVAAGVGFNAFVLVLFIAILIGIVAMVPSIAAEARPDIGLDTEESRRLGAWLDRGFKALRIAGYLVLAGLLIVLPVLEIWAVFDVQMKQKLSYWGWEWITDKSLLHWLGGAIVASVGMAITLRNVVFTGLGKAVDIGLDVDNWLKERPMARNPRGRILSRYLALLEHVQRGKYERIVIVAHSQGTVISADLLRFLHHYSNAAVGGEQLARTVRLATFGSPLHQLYSLRFPHMYAWVRANPPGASDIPAPDLNSLGVTAWVSGYRSGDYVGRYVLAEPSADPWAPSAALPAWNKNRTVDYCVGGGAHTHYFDATGDRVGQLIDQLVRSG